MESLSPYGAGRLNATLATQVGSAFDEVVAWWGLEQESRAHVPGSRIVERSALADTLRVHALERGATVIDTVGHFSAERLSD